MNTSMISTGQMHTFGIEVLVVILLSLHYNAPVCAQLSGLIAKCCCVNWTK